MAKGDYEVGYGKPPTRTRFQKGHSGNPNGRPKGSQNVLTVLNQELQQKVVVTEHGQRKTITKLQAAMKQVANKAASGDPRVIQFLVGVLNAQGPSEENPNPLPIEADQAVITTLLRRFRSHVPADSEDA